MTKGLAAARWVTTAGLAVRRRWRRSLQLRVVATTMLLGLVATAVLGTLLMRQIQAGLVNQRLAQARGEAARGLGDAQLKFDTVTDTSGLNLLVNDLLPRLASPDPDSSREVVLLRSEANIRPEVLPNLRTRDLTLGVVPPEIRRRVAKNGQTEEQFVRIAYDGTEGFKPGIAIGSPVQIPVAGEYEMYFVFSLQREQDTIDLVRRSLLVGGLLLVLMVGAVSYVVTRQVVRPVRQAALVAQRLSSGRLQERMVARGEDDLARLAASFNSMAQNLQLQITQLEQLSRVQQRFVSDVSHELRTPLTTIRMAGDILHEARAGFEPAVGRSAELLITQLDRFEGLLTDLLEMSRIDAGGSLLHREQVDLAKAAASVIETCSAVIANSGSAVTLLAAPQAAGGAPVVTADGRRIDRILRNLLVNALEHGEGKPIEIRVAATEQVVAISVRDHGVGLRPGEASLVFNRFWRADPSRARTLGGTGLGLAISIEDARLHGGWLQAWGEPGVGSCFRLTLPRRPDGEVVDSPLPLGPDADPPITVGSPYQRLGGDGG